MVTSPLIKSHACDFVIPVYVTPLPNDYVYHFNRLYNSWVLILYLALLNLYFLRSLSGKESQFLSEVVFAVTFGIYLCNLGTFWVLTNWHRCQGPKVQIFPGKNDRVWRPRKYFCGKTRIFSVEKVVYLPCWFHCKTFQILRSNSGFEKTHTR